MNDFKMVLQYANGLTYGQTLGVVKLLPWLKKELITK